MLIKCENVYENWLTSELDADFCARFLAVLNCCV